ncbi:integrase core domain-containing protein [Leucobacter chironomi]|uniref:integrase core domain-containing protein n=1 Tax=Leucobacter chironomi TaxID=491918 RepID=UPI000409725C
MLHRPVEPSQYTSLAFTEELQDAGITGSIGSVGDALDNALMESTIGLYKAEVIWHERAVWESWQQVEQATASWVQWYNAERLHSSLGDVPPVEYEEIYYDRSCRSGEAAAA